MLSDRGGVIRSVSTLYSTPCFPPGAGPDYVNAALCLHLNADARQALNLLHEVEEALERTRDQRWGQRTLDLDLLACGQRVRPDMRTVRTWIDLPLDQQMQVAPDELILPHPRLQERAFVLVPLMDIAPQWVHPLIGKTVRQMHADLPEADRKAVKPLVIQPENQ